MSKSAFPKLAEWRETRETLHTYCKVLGAFRAAFTPEQPRFQHGSLRLYTAGLTSTPIPHPSDPSRYFSLSLDLRNHYVLLSTSDGDIHQIRISEGLSASQLGEQLAAKLASLGMPGTIDETRFANDEPRTYALDTAERYFTALSHVGRILEQFRGEIAEETDPVQLWPHHFDLSFVALGKRMVQLVDGEQPSQITVGFAPDDPGQPSPYFYVSPFPFEESLTHHKLPHGGVWHTAVWQGALLPYAEIAEREDAETKVLEFLRAAYGFEKELI